MFLPKYDILSKAPPPINVTILNKNGKTVKKFNAKKNAYTLKEGAEHEPMFEEMPYFGISSGEKRNILVDLRPYFYNLSRGKYKVLIGLKRRYTTQSTQTDTLIVKVDSLNDSINNLLQTVFPEYMENKTFVQPLGSFDNIYYNDDSIVGYPLVSQQNINLMKIKNSLGNDIFSLLSPYLFFNLIYNNCEIKNEAIDLLSEFPQSLNGLALSLKYEIALISKDSKESGKIREQIANIYPGPPFLRSSPFSSVN
mgnify:CR=1 FL=1